MRASDEQGVRTNLAKDTAHRTTHRVSAAEPILSGVGTRFVWLPSARYRVGNLLMLPRRDDGGDDTRSVIQWPDWVTTVSSGERRQARDLGKTRPQQGEARSE